MLYDFPTRQWDNDGIYLTLKSFNGTDPNFPLKKLPAVHPVLMLDNTPTVTKMSMYLVSVGVTNCNNASSHISTVPPGTNVDL